MGDTVVLTLRCRDCENDNCVYCPNGRYIDGKEGCTRIVSEEDAARYEHYMKEIVPF